MQPSALVGRLNSANDPDADQTSVETAWRFCLRAADERRQRAGRLLAGQPLSAPTPVLPAPNWWHGAARELLELYAPMIALSPGQPFAVGHLAQGIDGTIATATGSSRRLSGDQNHLHLHRLRALADAVIIGATTAELDDPQLTVRLVPGQNPARVVIDPSLRLGNGLRLFNDATVPTYIACARQVAPAAIRRWGVSRVIAVHAEQGRLDLGQLFARLRECGYPVLLVEGGGVTVSRMLDAGCLDRVQISISPVVVGGARRGLQVNGPDRIDDCLRPSPRIFRMGEDLLWDLDLRGGAHAEAGRSDPTLRRII